MKVPLTSANVDEVIEKRLLKKSDAAEKKLTKIYKQDSAHLGSLLSFAEAGVQFKGYRGGGLRQQVPLRALPIRLFQNCRRALSTHNAFQGKHASVGERSMLGVFQQVSKTIEERELNALVSFDLMYEGIRNELRGEIQSAIILAGRNLVDPLAVKVLKALFLVKYFGNFKTTVRNVTVLMIDDAQVDIKEHEKAIVLALNVLENQSYVQRNGEEYGFLTDDEKDVERAIKDTDIENEEAVTNLLKETSSTRSSATSGSPPRQQAGPTTSPARSMGRCWERNANWEVEVITENHTDHENLDFLKAQTMGSTGMKLHLPPDAVFMKDVRMYLRTDKYVRVNQATANRDELKRILREKAEANAQRKRTLVQLWPGRNLAEATVYMNGAAHEMGHTTDGKTRVVTAFQDLVKIVYPNLRMLGPQPFSEDTIKQIVRTKQDDLFGADEQTISEAESEVLTLVARRQSQIRPHHLTGPQEPLRPEAIRMVSERGMGDGGALVQAWETGTEAGLEPAGGRHHTNGAVEQCPAGQLPAPSAGGYDSATVKARAQGRLRRGLRRKLSGQGGGKWRWPSRPSWKA
ncbi:MAG: hypothetical protein IPI41_03140 [Flavobacteriales bacterium]|nr:hypothetical protein [Flavobacteriales bacterium]